LVAIQTGFPFTPELAVNSLSDGGYQLPNRVGSGSLPFGPALLPRLVQHQPGRPRRGVPSPGAVSTRQLGLRYCPRSRARNRGPGAGPLLSAGRAFAFGISNRSAQFAEPHQLRVTGPVLGRGIVRRHQPHDYRRARDPARGAVRVVKFKTKA